MDPLNILMAILAIVLVITAWAVMSGYGMIAVPVLAGLIAWAYYKSPRRTFPTAEQVMKGVDLKGYNVMVTGPTSGIGIDTARALAAAGAHVFLVARNPTKLEETKRAIEKRVPSAKLSILTCDLGDLKSVQYCAEKFLEQKLNLHILINNAGIMALPERKSTTQGLEQQVGVCHVGHFLLTKLLLPSLQAGAKELAKPSRIVCLSSIAHTGHEMGKLLENPKLETVPYSEWVAYGNDKCANLLHAAQLNHRYADKGIIAFSVMPGGIHTGLQEHVGFWKKIKWAVVTPFFFKSTSQGAATTLLCATTADPADGGKYFENCQATNAVEQVKQDVGQDVAVRCFKATEVLLVDLEF
jgi:NAD(P)-dependent dehydrogenase (short-subunit alcohol dehydrogenase family)